jgi:hypothetical protein
MAKAYGKNHKSALPAAAWRSSIWLVERSLWHQPMIAIGSFLMAKLQLS